MAVHSFQRKRARRRHPGAENGVRTGEVVHRLLAPPKTQNVASDATTCAKAMAVREGESRGETVLAEGNGGGNVPGIETLSGCGRIPGFNDGRVWVRQWESKPRCGLGRLRSTGDPDVPNPTLEPRRYPVAGS